jgi:DNA-binding NarL/FixJ family response regulator
MIASSSVNNGTVLIVDDTPGNLALLSDTLSEAQYRVLVAIDGLSAIEQTQYLKPDIILLDVMMPGLDGFETCNRLKNNPATQSIPILFMTGLSELDHLLRGFDEGALDYIVKPIRPAEVLARIEVHLSQNRNLRRAERLLEDNAFAALSIDNQGCITWLTEAASQWLTDFNAMLEPASICVLGSSLPEPILKWFGLCRENVRLQPNKAVEQQFNNDFCARLQACEYPDQYLLFLQRNEIQNDWSPQALREKLKLTFREAEILMWIARGKTNKEIGIILDTSPRTVNKHLEHIFEKLGVCTRSAAVAKVFETETNA